MSFIYSIFKKLQSKKAVQNFSYLTISNFINQLSVVVSSIKIARVLGPADFGAYSYLFIQAVLYSTISELGIRNIAIRTIARDQNRSKAVFISSVFLQLIGLIIAVLILFTYEHYTKSISPDILKFLVLNVFVLNLWSSSESIWQGHQKMAVPAAVNVVFSLLWVFFVVLTHSDDFSIKFLFVTYTLFLTVKTVLLILIMYTKKDILAGRILSLRSASWDVFKDSSFYYLNNIISLPANALSNNFLERNSNKSELGYFNTSSRLMNPIKLIISIGLSAVFPNVSALWNKDRGKFVYTLETGFPLFIVICGWLCFSFVIVSKEMVLLLFGEAFLPAIKIIQFQIWFIFIFLINSFIGAIWGATDQQKLLAKFGIINSLVVTPFLWYGSRYGGIGLSYAFLVGFSATLPFVYLSFKRSLALKLSITKEASITFGFFLCSCFLPASTPLFIRLALVVLSFVVVVKLYYTVIRSKFLKL